MGRAKLAGATCAAVGPTVARAKQVRTAHLVFPRPLVRPMARVPLMGLMQMIFQTRTTTPASPPTKTPIWAPKAAVAVLGGDSVPTKVVAGNRFAKMATATARVATVDSGPRGRSTQAPVHHAILAVSKLALTTTIFQVDRFRTRCALRSGISVPTATNVSARMQAKGDVALAVVAAAAAKAVAVAVVISHAAAAVAGARQAKIAGFAPRQFLNADTRLESALRYLFYGCIYR